MREIVQFASRVNAPNVTKAEKQWLVLFARHFVDVLEGSQLLPDLPVRDTVPEIMDFTDVEGWLDL